MILLAIETSGKYTSVALVKDGFLVEELLLPPDDRQHSEKLLPLIDELLQKNRIDLSNSPVPPLQLRGGFDGQKFSIAVGVGPGSFTSLRVGLATSMGMAQALGSKIIPVSTLKALAFQCREQGRVAPVIKAGRGLVYAALYRWEKNHFVEDIPEALFDVKVFLEQLSSFSEKIYFVGSGLELFPEFLETRFILKKEILPRASSIALLALAEQINPVPASDIRLHYLQQPDLG